MSDVSRFDELNEDLRAIAESVAELPSEQFRRALRSRLESVARNQKGGRNLMTTPSATSQAASYMRPGLHTITPYLILPGARAFLEFAQKAFGAQELLIVPKEDGSVMHAELRIDDSVIEFADANAEIPARPMPIHLYVRNVDEMYQAALAAGAESLGEPTNQFYGDREATVRDAFGNNWYIATHQATGHKPEGLRAITPYLHARSASSLIEFLEKAFAAETLERYASDAGSIMHAKIRMGDSILEMSDAHGQWQPMTSGIQLFVPDVDESYRRALEAGATSDSAPEDKPYGERMAGIRDPEGNQWFLSYSLGRH